MNKSITVYEYSVCFRNKRSEHRNSVSESSSSRSYVSNKGSVKASESHLSHIGNVATTVSNRHLYHRDMVAHDTEEIARLSDSVDGFIQPILVSKDANPLRYCRFFIVLNWQLNLIFSLHLKTRFINNRAVKHLVGSF